ncbi:MAG: hypothetical protein NC541_11145 [bacterium]|nr:hypothetical protein [bacterium]
MAAVTDIKEQYRQDKRFRRYVDRYASGYQSGGQINVEEALRHAMVREAAAYYRGQEGGDAEGSDNSENDNE